VVALLQRCGFRTAGLQQFFVPKMPRTHALVTVGTGART